jgi:cell division protein FtsZ
MGEASGEKRVLTAAEVAISNPLIEDPSIKRASGLLISITGGKDLTLFEVDEAATRIREQADQDANIIVGATFDDSLEGTVRVSVVATGIDNTGPAIPSEESASTELARKLRNDSRYNDRAQPTTAEDVSFRPMPTMLSLLDAAQPEPPMSAASIPQAPQGMVYTQRMQRTDDGPLSAQNEIRAAHRKLSDNHLEKRLMPLMQRLASVGLSPRAEGGRPVGADAASAFRRLFTAND